MLYAPLLSLFHGYAVAIFGYVIAVISHDKFWP